VRGWWRFYRTSVGLGASYLRRHGFLREAVIRVVIPLDPSRYLELPWARGRLGPAPGERVLDLASPKLLAVVLSRDGAHVTSVDELPDEVERWRQLTAAERNLSLVVADGRALPFADGSFDHAVSISVIEHIRAPGDASALAELARCVVPGGRVVVTVPHATEPYDEFRGSAAYVDHGGEDGRWFFQHWYSVAELEALVGGIEGLRLVELSAVRLQPNLNAAYNRVFPLLVPLGPLFGLLARERVGPDGDVARLVLERL
jgi:SAM-dependent methyltransferase